MILSACGIVIVAILIVLGFLDEKLIVQNPMYGYPIVVFIWMAFSWFISTNKFTREMISIQEI